MKIDGVNFNEFNEALLREKEPLARAATSINMNGLIK